MTQEVFDSAEHGMGGMKRSALEPYPAAEIIYVCPLFFSITYQEQVSIFFFAIFGLTVLLKMSGCFHNAKFAFHKKGLDGSEQ